MDLPSSAIGIIGGADGPTSILVAGANPRGSIIAVFLVAAVLILAARHARKKK